MCYYSLMMYRLHIYLTEDLKNKLDILTRVSSKSKAEVVREALGVGLKKIQPQTSNSAKALLELADMAEILPSEQNAPKNVSDKHNFYAWGGDNNE